MNIRTHDENKEPLRTIMRSTQYLDNTHSTRHYGPVHHRTPESLCLAEQYYGAVTQLRVLLYVAPITKPPRLSATEPCKNPPPPPKKSYKYLKSNQIYSQTNALNKKLNHTRVLENSYMFRHRGVILGELQRSIRTDTSPLEAQCCVGTYIPLCL